MSAPMGQVGFSQRVRLEWLDKAASLAMASVEKGAATDTLRDLLRDKVSVGGSAVRGNREKVITILQRVWIDGSPELDNLRGRGLVLLTALPEDHHVIIHWGMVGAVYPFWTEIATQVGRLLTLQGSAGAAQVQRRVREHYGERETVSRAARRVLRSFIDWGVMEETGAKGVSKAARLTLVEDEDAITWLMEASLYGRGMSAAPLADLLSSPSLFPFRVSTTDAACRISASPSLEVFRHGLNQDLVMLRRDTSAP